MSHAASRAQAGRFRRLLLGVIVPVFMLASAPARALTPSPHVIALPDERDVTIEPPSVSGEGMRLDRQSRLLAATGYQTVLVTGVIGGAVIVGALAGGVHPAIIAGTAVFVAYLFLPWE